MRKGALIFYFCFFVISLRAGAQCSYNLLNINHIDCYNDNTGEIQISLSNSNATFWWDMPTGLNSTSMNLTNLIAGDYVLNIMENFIPGDTTSSIICFTTDTISVEQTIDITAEFILKNMCSSLDSANVFTTIYGGTRPYTTLWVQLADTNRNIMNVPPSNLPYTLNITDANGCQKNQYLSLEPAQKAQTFMSIENVICKDDNSGTARVYVEGGTPPFIFTWSTEEVFIDQESSQIYNLYPGIYSVHIRDTMGCIITDSIQIETNPEVCIKIYKVFSPNEDGINDFWVIENIHLYPEALVEVYDRLGNRVYRRRNYINSEEVAFNGKIEGIRLNSGTYYYILDLENNDQVFRGSLTIVR